MAINIKNDETLQKAIDKAAKKVAYEEFCDLALSVKEKLDEFKVGCNAVANMATKTANQEVFDEIESFYIDNKIFFDKAIDDLKNKYTNKNIGEENLKEFRQKKSKLQTSDLREYNDLLESFADFIKEFKKEIDQKVIAKKNRRENEKNKSNHSNKENDSSNDGPSSTGSNYGDYGLFGWGVGPY